MGKRGKRYEENGREMGGRKGYEGNGRDCIATPGMGRGWVSPQGDEHQG